MKKNFASFFHKLKREINRKIVRIQPLVRKFGIRNRKS